MSDKEIIVASLARIERRIRANRLFNELTFGAIFFLAIPLLLKFWDLFDPFRGVTISIIVGIWVLLFGAYVIWRALQKGTLNQAAVSADEKARSAGRTEDRLLVCQQSTSLRMGRRADPPRCPERAGLKLEHAVPATYSKDCL